MKNNKTNLVLLIVAITLIGIPQVSAYLLPQFNERYHTEGTDLDACITCHTFPGLNPYGTDLNNTSPELQHEPYDINFAGIEDWDSDGDGWSNIQEISARTFPGNNTSFPTNIMVYFHLTPRTFNLDNNDYYISGYIDLPRGFYFKTLDMKTITLGFAIPGVDPKNPILDPNYPNYKGFLGYPNYPIYLGFLYPDLNQIVIKDFDKDGVPEMMLKVNRKDVIDLLAKNGVYMDQKFYVTIMGNFLNQKATFEGTDFAIFYKIN